MKDPRDTSNPFKDFLGRDIELHSVIRYSLYYPMLYRSNLFTHAQRVASLVRAMNQAAQAVFGKTYDTRKAEIIALVHDDAEIIFGDIMAGNKSKMTAEQLMQVKEAEFAAINEISKRFPNCVEGYSYKQLLLEAAEYTSLESQVVCYADKYDALGEALHEIFAGNHAFVSRIVNEYGRIPTPTEYYANFFRTFADKYPNLKPLLAQPLPLLEPVPQLDYMRVVAQGVPHTRESIEQPTDDQH